VSFAFSSTSAHEFSDSHSATRRTTIVVVRDCEQDFSFLRFASSANKMAAGQFGEDLCSRLDMISMTS